MVRHWRFLFPCPPHGHWCLKKHARRGTSGRLYGLDSIRPTRRRPPQRGVRGRRGPVAHRPVYGLMSGSRSSPDSRLPMQSMHSGVVAGRAGPEGPPAQSPLRGQRRNSEHALACAAPTSRLIPCPVGRGDTWCEAGESISQGTFGQLYRPGVVAPARFRADRNGASADRRIGAPECPRTPDRAEFDRGDSYPLSRRDHCRPG